MKEDSVNKMEFTYDAYRKLLLTFKNNGYQDIFYQEADMTKKQVILRHDIDNSIEDALKIAEIEKEVGMKSTYFVLIGTEFYNLFTKRSKEMIEKIIAYGHSVQLHFDVTNYEIGSKGDLIQMIEKEMRILEMITKQPVHVVSFHRPLREYFNETISNSFISAYDKQFFSDFKYVSDSRRNWKDDPYEAVANGYRHIQCLTHAFWYDERERTAHDKIALFKTKCADKTKEALYQNITDLDELIK